MIYSIVLSFLVSVILIFFVIKFCNKHGIYDKTNARKVHTGNVPRLGAVGFVSGYAVGMILFLILNFNTIQWTRFLPLFISGLIIFIFGILDDFVELPAKTKLFVQCISAGILVGFGFRFKNILGIDIGWFSYILTFVWIIGVINAFNLIDGVDALCGGLSFFIILTIGLMNLKTGSHVSAICFILIAAIAGFLIYNKPKAKIFMGDGGSQFLGFTIAVLPLYNQVECDNPVQLFNIALLCAIPIFDTFAAMWRRKREHRSFFDADKSHLHHKLMNMGYHTTGILGLLYSIQIFLCIVVMISDFIRGRKCYLILFAGYFAMILFFALIHFTNRAVTLSKRPDFKSEIDEH